MDSQESAPKTLKLSALPLDIAGGDIAANLARTEEAIAAVSAYSHLIVLPEMFTTGFTLNPQKIALLAQPDDGTAMTTVGRLAQSHGVAICGSYLSTDGDGRYFNRAFFALPSGEIRFYNKRHLFSIGGESRVMTGGSGQSPIVTFDGWRIKMAVCYDLRFPVWNRRATDGGDYDLLLIPANWPDSRRYAWEHLLIARAIENQAYVAGVNRSGADKAGTYSIDSTLIIDPWGKPTGTIEKRSGVDIVAATLRKETVNEARDNFPVWRDADRFTLS